MLSSGMKTTCFFEGEDEGGGDLGHAQARAVGVDSLGLARFYVPAQAPFWRCAMTAPR